MDYPIETVFVQVGGVIVKLNSEEFLTLVEKEQLTTIHGQIGTISRWHIYLTKSQGITFYIKSKDPLPKFQADIEASKIESGIKL